MENIKLTREGHAAVIYDNVLGSMIFVSPEDYEFVENLELVKWHNPRTGRVELWDSRPLTVLIKERELGRALGKQEYAVQKDNNRHSLDYSRENIEVLSYYRYNKRYPKIRKNK